MAIKRGAELELLKDGREISGVRLWSIRLIILLFELQILVSVFSYSGLAKIVGGLIGSTAVIGFWYWLFLRILSKPEGSYEEKLKEKLKSISEPSGNDNNTISLNIDDKAPETIIIDKCADGDVVTKRELIRAVEPHVETRSAEHCWEDVVRPVLSNIDHIEKLDASGRRWQLQME